MKRLATILALLLPLTARATYDPAFGDDIDRTADDFVTVSLVVADPGAVLYSRLGHAALHMQCPVFNLDYIYSYESEDASSRFLSFLAGSLKMGMIAVGVEEYLEGFRNDGRGVREYRLNLPIETKRELWRVLDQKIEEGQNLEYDYIRRGCAQSTFSFIIEAARRGNSHIEFAWPEKFRKQTRREIVSAQFSQDKWARAFITFLSNGIIDKTDCNLAEKVSTPADLVIVLRHATVDGIAVIDSQPVEMLPSVNRLHPCPFSPLMAVIVLFAVMLICSFKGWKAMDYVLLAIQTILGLATTYLVFFSSLVCTEWSWLIIPFNPLPLCFWKWRDKWRLPYAVVLLVWCGFMIFWPHQLTDPAYIILTFTLAVSYALNSVKTIKK